MRVHIRRVVKSSTLMFGILGALIYFYNSPFFFNSSSSSNSSARKRTAPLDRLQDLSKLKIDFLEKESRRGGDRPQTPTEGADVGVGVDVEVDIDNGKSRLHPAAVSNSDPPVYDWWKDFGAKYFRGDTLPDDMLAVVSLSVCSDRPRGYNKFVFVLSR